MSTAPSTDEPWTRRMFRDSVNDAQEAKVAHPHGHSPGEGHQGTWRVYHLAHFGPQFGPSKFFSSLFLPAFGACSIPLAGPRTPNPSPPQSLEAEAFELEAPRQGGESLERRIPSLQGLEGS